jgi:hypothetical protein
MLTALLQQVATRHENVVTAKSEVLTAALLKIQSSGMCRCHLARSF